MLIIDIIVAGGEERRITGEEERWKGGGYLHQE